MMILIMSHHTNNTHDNNNDINLVIIGQCMLSADLGVGLSTSS